MNDPRTLFRDTDRIPAPDLWPEIESRPTRRMPPGLGAGRRLVVVGLALAVAAAGVVVAARAFLSEGPSRPATRQTSVEVDPRVAATIPVGPFPAGLAAGMGSVWVAIPGEGCRGEVVRIDQATNEIAARIPVGANPSDLAVGFGAVWGEGDSCIESNGAVFRIDPAADAVSDLIPVGRWTSDIAVGEGAVWVTRSADLRGELLRIDPATTEVTEIPIEGGPADVVAGEGGVWVLNTLPPPGRAPLTGMELIHVDPATGGVVGRIPDIESIGVGEGYAWAGVWTAPSEAALVRIDPGTSEVVGEPISRDFRGFGLEHGQVGILPVGEGGVWFWAFPERSAASASGHGAVYRLNAETLQEDAKVSFDPDRDWIDAALDPATHTLWISHYSDQVTRIDLR